MIVFSSPSPYHGNYTIIIKIAYRPTYEDPLLSLSSQSWTVFLRIRFLYMYLWGYGLVEPTRGKVV